MRDDGDGYALLEATARGDLQDVTTLLELGADVNRTDKKGESALHKAAARRQIAAAEVLLTRGADVNRADCGGDTAFHRAAESGHLTVTEALLARGVSVNHVGASRRSALSLAAGAGHTAMVQALLARHADVNHRDEDGSTALSWAACSGNVTIAKALLERGATVNCTENNGCSPLHSAAREGHMTMVEELLARGADVRIADTFGDTAFHEAADNHNESVALALWRAGADPLRKNNKGQTPLSRLPKDSDAAKQMRTRPRPHLNPCGSQSNIRQILTFVSSRSQSEEETVTAQDAIPELQHVLQLHLSQAGSGVTVLVDEVEDVVMQQMDHDTGLLGVDAVIKSFYELCKKYPAVRRQREPPELRATFKKATRSKNVLRSKLAKRLLRSLFDKSAADAGSSRASVSFSRSNKEWDEAKVDALLAAQGRDENVIDEEGFVKVGMKVLFLNV